MSSRSLNCKFDIEGQCLDASSSLGELLGYEREELNQLHFNEIFLPEAADNPFILANRITSPEFRELQCTISAKPKTGSTFQVDMHLVLVRDASGSPDYVVCHCQPVAHNDEGDRLNSSARDQRFRFLYHHNPLPVFHFDTEGQFIDANPRFEDLSGYTAQELRDKTFAPFVARKDLDQVWRHFEETLSGETPEYEITGITRSGERREVYITNFPLISNGEITGVVGIAQDITDRKEAENKLRESEERWQRLVEQNPQPIQITQDAEIIFINQAGVDLYGADSAEELIGRSVYEFSDPDMVDKIKDRKNRLEEGKPVEEVFEHKLNCLDGEERYIEIYSIPTTYNGKSTIQSVFYNVTDRKQKEQELIKSLDEKKMLLREIHHRVKNNLAVISGLLELQVMATTNESVIDTLRESQLRVRSIALIHEKLYQSDALSDIGFDRYLKELVQAISNTYNAGNTDVALKFELDPFTLDLDKAIPCSLIVNEVVVNCYKHAFKEQKKGEILLQTNVDDSQVLLTIQDNGSGLPENFDLEEQDSLGLTLIQTLAVQLEGEVSFSSVENGTAFSLTFEP